MKLSNLNKFKNQLVLVEYVVATEDYIGSGYYEQHEQDRQYEVGILDEVSANKITLSVNNGGFRIIPIDDIRFIGLHADNTERNKSISQMNTSQNESKEEIK